MDPHHLFPTDLPPRSSSMPSPGTAFPQRYFQPLVSNTPQRKMSGRRDSEIMLSEGPITPPESPSSTQMDLEPQPALSPASGAILPPPPPFLHHQQSFQQQQQQHANVPLQVVLNHVRGPSFSQCTSVSTAAADYPVTPVSQDPDDLDEDEPMQDAPQAPSIALQPLRSLSQENIDLPSTRSLVLRDFEVRGTLGAFHNPLSRKQLVDLLFIYLPARVCINVRTQKVLGPSARCCSCGCGVHQRARTRQTISR